MNSRLIQVKRLVVSYITATYSKGSYRHNIFGMFRSLYTFCFEFTHMWKTLAWPHHFTKVERKYQWHSQELYAVKNDKRKAEHVWRRTKLEVHRQIFKEKCNASSRLLFQSKQDYYSTNIIECGNGTKKLYKLTNKLMGKNQDVVLPTSDSDTELSNRFSDCFLGKIHIIR